MNIQEIKKRSLPLMKPFGVRRAAVFGSAAHGTMKKGSDIDFLLSIPKGKSLLDVAGLKIDLEEALNHSVDLVEYDALKPRIRDRVLKEQVIIL